MNAQIIPASDARSAKDAFERPDHNELGALKPGDLVLLGFKEHRDGPSERLWVELTHVRDTHLRFRGRVAPLTEFVREAWRGCTVWFSPDDVLDIALVN